MLPQSNTVIHWSEKSLDLLVHTFCCKPFWINIEKELIKNVIFFLRCFSELRCCDWMRGFTLELEDLYFCGKIERDINKIFYKREIYFFTDFCLTFFDVCFSNFKKHYMCCCMHLSFQEAVTLFRNKASCTICHFVSGLYFF